MNPLDQFKYDGKLVSKEEFERLTGKPFEEFREEALRSTVITVNNYRQTPNYGGTIWIAYPPKRKLVIRG